ncbi:TonB-dependent receptor [Thalassomonas haliotis]|uniref:TonB-dependent receptor n=1 Tax=Thalassomonas haliotis TaxID=485448 RepID=A0ABY7VLS7_9GAMM|nr:TonB-dependent receptor [Thalassomonas haliotis]WDE14199.1 TonB-dependent receptor [Thalassomonas haliotis]
MNCVIRYFLLKQRVAGILLSLSLLVITCLSPVFIQKVSAQSPGQAQEQTDNIEALYQLSLEDLINIQFSTGIAGPAQKKLDSSIAITTISFDDITTLQPQSTADLLEVVPGFFTEDSAGEVQNNFSARGTWGDSNRMIGMHNDGVMHAYSDIFNGSLSKIDLMTEKVEVVRGGSAGIISSRGPSSVVNYITRKGSITGQGQSALRISDHHTRRFDGYYSGPLTDHWLFALGGFYRRQDGLRDRGFTADNGGQFRFNLSRQLAPAQLDGGELVLSYQHVNDKNAFYLPTPMTNMKDPRAIPGGINALKGSLASLDARQINLVSPEGLISHDLADGIHTRANIFGLDINKSFNKRRWSLSNQLRIMHYKGDGNAVYPSGNNQIQPALQRLYGDKGIAATMFTAFPEAVSLQYAYAGSGELIADEQMSALNRNGLTQELSYRHFGYHLSQVVNNVTVRYESPNNILTLGSVYLKADYDKLYRDQHKYLAELTNNGRKLDVVALNANEDVIGHYTREGFSDFFTEFSLGDAKLDSLSVYLLDEYQLTDKVRMDFGVRYEDLTVKTRAWLVETDLNIPADDDLNILADDNVRTWRGDKRFTPSPRHESDIGWSVGANYHVNDQLAFYSRYTDTFMFRSDLLGEVINAARGLDVTREQKDSKTELNFFEIGLRYASKNFATSLTLYNTEFTPQAINVTVTENGRDVLKSIEFDTRAWGVEFEANWSPRPWFTLAITGVLQNAEYTGAQGLIDGIEVDGNQINRIANEQIRLTPNFYFAQGELFFTYHYLGERFGNAANTSKLPAYATLAAGISFHLDDNITLMLKGSNLTGQIGLSEGNPRDQSQFSQLEIADNFYARSIFGRIFTASLTYTF